ncbi:hypothetical protein CYMTET_44442 [Cymbomonas tetramitiformis]|uniref:DUF6589 domain-containing protein n=1 Tax=Cymbomonas tetramitiformis TaxID=36881 RepID=A0AAE0C098_9CHLO|nr:hypothetical protein CYMTET_44442 [Cymbomonas tetramitiformis]
MVNKPTWWEDIAFVMNKCMASDEEEGGGIFEISACDSVLCDRASTREAQGAIGTTLEACDADMTEVMDDVVEDRDDSEEESMAPSDASSEATDESDSSYEADEDSEMSTRVPRTPQIDLEALGVAMDCELVVVKKHPAFSYFRDAFGDLEGSDMDLARFQTALDGHCPVLSKMASRLLAAGFAKRNSVSGNFNASGKRDTIMMGIILMLSSTSTRLFRMVRMLFTMVLFTVSRNNTLVLKLMSSSFFRLAYSPTHSRKKFIELSEHRQSEVVARLSTSSTLKVVCLDNWQVYIGPRTERMKDPNYMLHGVQRGVCEAVGAEDFSVSSVDPTIPLHHLTPGDVLNGGVAESGGVIPDGKASTLLHDRLQVYVQTMMVDAGVQDVHVPEAPEEKRWARGFEKTKLQTLIMLMHVQLSSAAGNQEAFQSFEDEFGFDGSSDDLHRRHALIFGDGVPYMQAQREIQRMALEQGKRHWLVPYPGLFHAYWHCLESILKLGWDLGFGTLAELLGRKKVRRDATKVIMEVHHDFLTVVVKGMWAAILEEWGRHAAKRMDEMDTVAKVADLHAFMGTVCESKQFVKFWWTQILTKYAFMYFEFRRAIRESDIMMIECIMRKMLYIFKFTHKVICRRVLLNSTIANLPEGLRGALWCIEGL